MTKDACVAPCKWVDPSDVINNISKLSVCTPNDLTADQASKDQCSALTSVDTCFAPCKWVAFDALLAVADLDGEFCKPNTSGISLISNWESCGKMTSEVVCDANADCKWGATTVIPTGIPERNCLPRSM